MTNIMLQAMTMICNTILIIESTHKKAIFTFLKVLTYKIGSNIVFLHLLHRWIDWMLIVKSHNFDCSKKKLLL